MLNVRRYLSKNDFTIFAIFEEYDKSQKCNIYTRAAPGYV